MAYNRSTVRSILKKVFYIGDAFYTFPPTFAQGASQSIESGSELFDTHELRKHNKILILKKDLRK